MNHRISTLHRVAFSLFALALCWSAVPQAPLFAQASMDREHVTRVLQANCFDCHGGGEKEGGLQLDQLLNEPDSDVSRNRWWKVLNNIRAGTMPPPDSGSKLTDDEATQLLSWLKYSALKIDPSNPNPGRPTVRRLSRREYANTIRDLMHIDYNAEVMFPPDDSGYGFDNIGDAQSLSLMLLEKYLAAAKEIVDQAVPTVCKVIPKQSFQAKDFRDAQRKRDGDNMRLEEPHTVRRKVNVDQSGDFQVTFNIKEHGSFEFNPQRSKLSLSIDGVVVHEVEVGWDESKRTKLPFQVQWNRANISCL